METIIDLIFFALAVIMMAATYVGAKNLSKSPVRVYLVNIVCGVIAGCLLGYQRSDIGFGLMVGIFLGLLFVLVGAVSRWQIKQFTELEQKQTKKK
jgi:hypothetical protein